jgi:Flp pilus assembly protein TadG
MLSFNRFIKDTKGAVTIEFTVLVPAFVFLMILFVDTSIVYLTHSEMYNAARDVARRMATHELQTESDVQAYTAEHLFLGMRTYTVVPNFGGEMSVSISVSVNQAVFFGVFFEPILGKSLVATASVRREAPLIGTS